MPRTQNPPSGFLPGDTKRILSNIIDVSVVSDFSLMEIEAISHFSMTSRDLERPRQDQAAVHFVARLSWRR